MLWSVIGVIAVAAAVIFGINASRERETRVPVPVKVARSRRPTR